VGCGGAMDCYHARPTHNDRICSAANRGWPSHAWFARIATRNQISQAIDALLLVDLCSEPDEWCNRIEFLPL
jgi:hypothetical protein